MKDIRIAYLMAYPTKFRRVIILAGLIVFGFAFGKFQLPAKSFGKAEDLVRNRFLNEYRNNLSLVEHLAAPLILSSRIIDVQTDPDACDVNKLAAEPVKMSAHKVTIRSYTLFRIPISTIEFRCDFAWSRK